MMSDKARKENGLVTGFLRSVMRSAYDMEWYRVIRSRPWTRALRYAAGLFLLLSFGVALAAAPEIVGSLGAADSVIRQHIPEGTTAEMKDGRLSTSLPSPTVFGSGEDSVTIDTSVTGMDFPDYFDEKSGLVIGRDALFYADSEVERSVYSLTEVPDFSVSRETALGWIGSYGIFIAIFAVVLLFMAFFIGTAVATCIYVLVASGLSYLLGRLWKVRFTYAQWLAIGFHAVTLPSFLDILFGFWGVQIPYAFSVIFFMFVFSVIVDERLRPTTSGGSVVPVRERRLADGTPPPEGKEKPRQTEKKKKESGPDGRG